jgi:hypothetical protein
MPVLERWTAWLRHPDSGRLRRASERTGDAAG